MIQETINLLGRRAIDKITGFSGVIESVCFDLYGCVQACIKPPLDKDGKFQDAGWLDIQRLTIDQEQVMPIPDFDKKGDSPSEYDFGPALKPLQRGI